MYGMRGSERGAHARSDMRRESSPETLRFPGSSSIDGEAGELGQMTEHARWICKCAAVGQRGNGGAGSSLR